MYCKAILPKDHFKRWDTRWAQGCLNCNKIRNELRQESRFPALLSKYGLTQDEYQSLLEKQGDCCAICKISSETQKLVIDHDHETGKVRGLLCSSCNWGLGHFKDSIAFLDLAQIYLLNSKVN